ncbi:MAG: hypothetical protein H5U22_06650 [Rhizobium sp.]|nr:hypothetical protein [Rhizobium sp.]
MINPDNHEYFEPGDAVRTVQNPHLTGQVINERDWGGEYQVRLADGMTVQWFKYYEIELDEDAEPPADAIDSAAIDNVVRVDFTKRRTMTAGTKTEGAA